MIIKRMSQMGVRSEHAYMAAMGSIGLSIGSWLMSRKKENEGIDRADRWGIFVGQWAPTFLGIGIALHQYELAERKK